MVYNYTKPRGPVAAMYSGPGPVYALPTLVGQTHHDPRSVHSRGPAYPFGLRHGNDSDDSGPGPAYLPDAKLYRTGKDQPPAYSLVGRPRDLSSHKTPGPMDYSADDRQSILSAHSRPPSYSFGLKRHDHDTDTTPGPAHYVFPSNRTHLVSSKRRAPSYPIVSRSKIGSFDEDLKQTPAPCAYKPVEVGRYLRRSPAYSMTSRNLMPGDRTQIPGPGAHSTEKVWVHKREPPRFSFGIRHSPYAGTFICNTVDDY
jgi:hypothetical protein